MLKSDLQSDLRRILQELGINDIEPQIERPSDLSHGDYSTNIALVAAKKLNISPREVAEEIISKFKVQSSKFKAFDKIEMAGAGFINFWLATNELSNNLNQLLRGDEKIIPSRISEDKKVMVEFAHPNTHKALHIGHLRNLSIGESLVRLLEATGSKVIRANYQGDVGMHIAKAIYGLLNLEPFKDQLDSITGIGPRVGFLGKAYAAGSNAYEVDPQAKEKIHDYNYLVYASAQKFQQERGEAAGTTDYLKFVKGQKEELENVFKVWKKTRQWSLDYFEQMYKALGSHFDRFYFESECLSGLDIARKAVEQGILLESEGAIIFSGEQYGLDTRVFVNSLGLPTYEAKELALSKKETTEYGTLDKIIHVVGPEQASFFQVTFKVEELMGIQKKQQKHLIYGWVRLKKGKMSSRLGNVITADQLVTEVKEAIAEILKASNARQIDEKTAEQIAIAAIKYTFLKVSTTQEIAFDLQDSVSAEGNSGPYLQYTYARTQSVLRKSEIRNPKFETSPNIQNYKFETEESILLRLLYFFDEAVIETAEKYSPNIVANYLYNLAQVFNLFYQKHQILNSESNMKEFRLALTEAVGITIKKGLYLLGIEAPEKM